MGLSWLIGIFGVGVWNGPDGVEVSVPPRTSGNHFCVGEEETVEILLEVIVIVSNPDEMVGETVVLRTDVTVGVGVGKGVGVEVPDCESGLSTGVLRGTSVGESVGVRTLIEEVLLDQVAEELALV